MEKLKLKQRAVLYFTPPQQVCFKGPWLTADAAVGPVLWTRLDITAVLLQQEKCGNTETLRKIPCSRWRREVGERRAGGVGRRLTSLMSSSSSAGLQSISVIFPLVVAAMAITALLPPEGRWGQEGLFNEHQSDTRHQSISQVTHWSRHEDTSPNKLTLLLLLGDNAIDFVRFRNV